MNKYKESAPLSEARIYEQHMEEFIPKEEKPCFHLAPRVGWMNDPNGFSYFKGQYHLFYQYNPYGTVWAPMHWGHAVSHDLVTWTHLPAALAPDMPYDDKEGCFSGSAVGLPDGRHLLMYTGVGADGRNADGTIRTKQTQCLAVGDGENYTKLDINPVIDASTLPEGSSSVDFRDPKIWREDDGTYRAVIASLDTNKSGQIVLYKSDDAMKWEFVSVIARNNGRYGRMWECPDLFELDGYDVLLISPQDMLPEGHEFYSGNGTLCLIGHMDNNTNELVEESATTIDHGIDFYATQTILTPDGRRVMVAWMQNWDSISGIAPNVRWFGEMTIPRELSVRDGHLYQWPVRELETYRSQQVIHKDVELGGDPVVLDGVKGRVVDLLVDVRPTEGGGTYQEFVIWFARNDRFHCSLRYRPATGRLVMSRIHSGSRRAFVHHRKCDVDGAPTKLSLRLVMDRQSVEVFVNGGRQTLSMIIPTDLDADMISFFSRGLVTLDVEKYDLC